MLESKSDDERVFKGLVYLVACYFRIPPFLILVFVRLMSKGKNRPRPIYLQEQMDGSYTRNWYNSSYVPGT